MRCRAVAVRSWAVGHKALHKGFCDIADLRECRHFTVQSLVGQAAQMTDLQECYPKECCGNGKSQR